MNADGFRSTPNHHGDLKGAIFLAETNLFPNRIPERPAASSILVITIVVDRGHNRRACYRAEQVALVRSPPGRSP